MLPTHGRYDYSNITARPDYAWPGGRRLAVYAALNNEAFGFGVGKGVAARWATYPVSGPTPAAEAVRTRQVVLAVGLAQILERYPDLPMAVEFRQASWLLPQRQARVFDLLRNLELSYVCIDEPGMPRMTTAWRSSRVGTLLSVLTSRNRPARRSLGFGNRNAAARPCPSPRSPWQAAQWRAKSCLPNSA